MGKKLSIIVIALLYQVSFVSYTQAGFYDWLVSNKRSNDILVKTTEESRVSLDSFHRWTESITESVQKEPKIEYTVIRESLRQVTAYNVGDPYQTDSTPCIGAYSKVDLCEEVERGVRVCAANFVPLGTILRIISEEDPSFECIVWDRMHSRFSTRVDIAMSLAEKSQAKQFGKQTLKVQVLKEDTNKDVSI